MPDASRNALIAAIVEVERELAHRIQGGRPKSAFDERLGSLTLYQLEAISHLQREPHSMSALASALEISESSATSLVDRLVRAGVVERTRIEEDRRKVMVTLTASSHELIERFRESRLHRVADVLDVLDDEELAELYRLFSKIVHPSRSTHE
ncbi:MAG: MarR family winged helix-turn-helix transcriptional regulator [Acidimicrobiales bacterium]